MKLSKEVLVMHSDALTQIWLEGAEKYCAAQMKGGIGIEEIKEIMVCSAAALRANVFKRTPHEIVAALTAPHPEAECKECEGRGRNEN